MANRPIFVPKESGQMLVETLAIEFVWHAGLSKSQKQKSIRSLHDSARETAGIRRILEISSKSETNLGMELSAFNLSLRDSIGRSSSVETLFQGSKVFSQGGPYTDLYRKTSREAKKDERLRSSGHLIAFQYEGRDWPLVPQTVFYDWLYLSALAQNPELSEQLLAYDGYSDIEFNPQKSINCQAASAALYKSLFKRNLLHIAMSSPDEFVRIHKAQDIRSNPIQDGLF